MRSGLALALAVQALAACSTPQFDVTPRYGYLDIEGDIGVSDASLSGGVTATNDVGDLGFQEDDGVPGVRADLKFGVPHIVLNYQQSDHGGSGQATATISDGDGNSIAAGTPVDSDLELGVLNGLLLFDFFPLMDTFELAIGFGATALEIDTAITDQTNPSSSVSAEATVPLPVVALQVGGEIGAFELAGLVQGITAQYEGDEATYLDLDAFFRWRFLGEQRGLGLMIGYRRFLIDAEYDDGDTDADLDVTFSGPYLALQISF
jgi:hypothetical protein